MNFIDEYIFVLMIIFCMSCHYSNKLHKLKINYEQQEFKLKIQRLKIRLEEVYKINPKKYMKDFLDNISKDTNKICHSMMGGPYFECHNSSSGYYHIVDIGRENYQEFDTLLHGDEKLYEKLKCNIIKQNNNI